MTKYIVAALYKFVSLPDYHELQRSFLSFCNGHSIKGTVLLAEEGINGTVAGSRQAIDALKKYLDQDDRFQGLEYKESFAREQPFYRMKVRLKKEIVTLGQLGVNPAQQVGTYVEPTHWNALLEDPEVIVLDTRNRYEVSIGTFKNAIDPKTSSFRQFPNFVETELDPTRHKKVAMFCTGGIRCEKASSYMLSRGFKEVYHLKGGILKYLETVPQEDSLWKGECFVFDQRVAVGHGLEEGDYDQCHGCRHPLNPEEILSEKYEEGVSCPKCYDTLDGRRRQRAVSRHQQIKLAATRNQQHLGAEMTKK